MLYMVFTCFKLAVKSRRNVLLLATDTSRILVNEYAFPRLAIF
jgi:hypothetical protein